MKLKFLIIIGVLASAGTATAAELSPPQKSFLSFESSGESTGSETYNLDLDHALASGNRLLLAGSHTIVSTGAQQFRGNVAQIGFSSDPSQRWSHRGAYEFGTLGGNLEFFSLGYSLNLNTDHWGLGVTPDAGRITAIAGTPPTRADIDRLGLKIDLNYYPDGPWRFLVSAAGNNFYGDETSIPTFLLIVRYTSAGLFISNFYKTRYGLETSYDFAQGSFSIGGEQIKAGTLTASTFYLAADGSLSDSLSLHSEFGQSYAGLIGWYGRFGLSYSY